MLGFVYHMREFWRLYVVEILFFIASLILINHLYGVSIEKHSFYTAKAESQYNAHKQLEPRGIISFSSKDNPYIPAAVNEKISYIYVAPSEVTSADQGKFLKTVIPLFTLSEDDWNEKLGDKKSHYDPVELNPTPDIVKRVKELKLRGLYVGERLKRSYPNKELAASVLGFVSDPYNNPLGQYGIEEAYQRVLGDIDNPSDLILTIDYNIQQKGEQVLDGLMKEWKAESAALIVEDPKTGKILAMGQKPGFDPNSYTDFSLKSFMNQNISSVYEPGSVFKALTYASALDVGKITPEMTYYDSGTLTLSGYTINNWDKKAHGVTTMVGVLENSLNTGAAFIERTLGHDLFLAYVKNFGFGAKAGIDLPGEVGGNVNNLKGFKDLHFATASFGQGISVTPIQLISAMSTIGNKGVLMKPYLVDTILHSDGTIEVTEPKMGRKILGEETAKKTVDALVSVVNHGHVGVVPGYRVAGKTGTAQIPSANGKYDEAAYIHSFFGFAPADNPKFIVLIKLVRPIGAPLSGMTVVPAFREFTKFLLDYYQILPDQKQ